ncbi:folate-binding protein YgfZ [Phenylobacterium sp.]|uniref:CAF17-like 4Fe-4S cluster assembly/insertion protein YgfZ n=1 Tax=Phenylobacterium sp. TaxID=1871053 RepID=UPI00286C9B03|nr:folate-binding protein YgfZ [Phenylobacterium sp.]
MSQTLTFAPRPSRALIAVSGPDWRTFLQGLITQDVATLAPGEARFGALLTPQGRLLYDLFVVGRTDGCWLDVLTEHRAAIVQRLTMYRLRAKVEIALDETPVSILFSAHPRESGDPGFFRSGATTPEGAGGQTSETQNAWVPAFAGMSGLFRDPRLPALGWRGYGATPPAGAALADEDAREAQRLALGVPGPADWGADTTYPIEANFDLLNGIDFQKGCFVGQETTSRMKRRGQIKSRMLPIAFEGPAPAAGAEVLAGDLRAGVVTSSGEGRAIALLRLDRALAASLTVDARPVTVERPAWFLAAVGEEAG